ncbi:hypothetical protein LXT12_25835 [Pelomonas sp. P7]|uniref:L,D-transpeptidase catalytic domain n=1 Tax=Pelomonas caseinilytica TaxID=2906763 RepID=A0ABS8XPT5_9BURK|nr:hypothetical protein [Pelomonas sp. P7]MCE4540659.1 hypothetical protein [Pelomonas sp. P7]
MTEPTRPTNRIPNSNQNSFHKILYTKSLDQSGWLAIRIPEGIVAVPEYLKVSENQTKDGRIYFSILEGRYKGKIASLALENREKCLISAKRGSGAKLIAKILGRQQLKSVARHGEVRNQLVAKLSFDGKIATISLDSDVDFTETNPTSPDYNKTLHSKPLPKGTYKILTPDGAHNARFTNFYVQYQSDLKYHTVWFPIEYAGNHNSSFVHVGNLSEGCVTIYQFDMWNSVYDYLIKNRMDSNGKYVGTITIE